MIRVLIADDEVEIEREIKSIFDWKDSEFEVIEKVNDVKNTLKIIEKQKPDLILLNLDNEDFHKFDLIDSINKLVDNSTIIIIMDSGNFKYEKCKLKLKVFDYISKPINKESFKKTINKAKEEIINRRKEDKQNYSYLKEKFLKDWMNGKVRSIEIENNMKYFNINYTKSMGLIVVKPLVQNKLTNEKELRLNLISENISNIAKDIMSRFKYSNVFVDSKNQVVILCDTNPIKYWHGTVNELENMINRYLNINVVICASFLRNDPIQINVVYKSLCNRLIDKSNKTNVIIEAQKYINRNYNNEYLSISEIANSLGVSQTYLSRMFKREMGSTFSQYLTNVRIKNAIILMRDPSLRLNEIARLIGYGTQNYFNNIFKRSVGISPEDYKIGVVNQEGR